MIFPSQNGARDRFCSETILRIEGVEGWISTKTKFNEPLVLKSSGYLVEIETSGVFGQRGILGKQTNFS